MVHLRGKIGEVVQARPCAVEENDIVWITLALQKDAAQIGGALRRDIFAETEAGRHVEFAGLAHFRRQNLIVVEAQRAAAALLRKCGDHARHHRHGGAEFHRCADRVGHLQGAPLKRHLDKGRDAALRLEIALCAIEIVFGQHAHAEPPAGRLKSFAQDQTVVAGFLDAAKVQRVAVFGAQHQTEHFRIKPLAGGEVFHRQHDMA